MPLLRRRLKRLREHRQAAGLIHWTGPHRELARLGASKAAVNADNIAQIKELQQVPARIACIGLGYANLNIARAVANLKERQLSHETQQHDTSGNAQLRVFADFAGRNITLIA